MNERATVEDILSGSFDTEGYTHYKILAGSDILDIGQADDVGQYLCEKIRGDNELARVFNRAWPRSCAWVVECWKEPDESPD